MNTFIWDGELPDGGIGWVDKGELLVSSHVHDGKGGIPPALPHLPVKEEQLHGADAIAAAATARITPSSSMTPITRPVSVSHRGPDEFSAPPFPNGGATCSKPLLPPPFDTICSYGASASSPYQPLPDGLGGSFSADRVAGCTLPTGSVTQPAKRTSFNPPAAAAVAAAASGVAAFDPGLQLMCQHMLAWQGSKKLQEARGSQIQARHTSSHVSGWPLEESKGQQSQLALTLRRHNIVVRSHSVARGLSQMAGSAGGLHGVPRASGGI